MPPQRKLDAGNAMPAALMGLQADIDKYVPTPSCKTLKMVAFIDAIHFEIHEGNTYFVSWKSPDASPIADDATIIFVFETGANQIHMIFAGSAGGDAQLEFNEDTVFSLGNPLFPYNRNRHKQNPDTGVTVTATLNPTVAAGPDEGTPLQDKFLAGGIGGNSPGTSGGGPRNEWVLDVNTTYMLRLTNRAGSAQPMSLEAEWYEEPGEVIV